MAEQLVGFVDADCFYVSCERKRDATLRGRPVGVLSNQDSCVIAASYELKALGVKVGTPIWEVHKKCSNAILCRRDFEWYGEVSRQLHELLKTVSPRVEYYSVDEFFFDADDLLGTLEAADAREAARLLQRLVWNKLELAVSVGLSSSRTLAKLACKQGKPNGAEAWTDPDDIAHRLDAIPVNEIAGVARGRLRRLERLGITTCGQLQRANRIVIRNVLSIQGECYWWELNGEAVQPIRTRRAPRRSMVRGGSVREATCDEDVLWAWTVRNSERVIGALIREQRRCRRIGLSLDFRPLGSRYSNSDSRGNVWEGSASLDQESRSASVIVPLLRNLFDAGLRYGREHSVTLNDAHGNHAHEKRVLVSRVNVSALELVADETRQLSLFETADSDRVDLLRESVNRRHGRFTLRSGATAPIGHLYQDRLTNYDISDIPGKVCF